MRRAPKKRARPQYLVFISHSSKDKWIATQMSQLIEQHGRPYDVKTFLDEKDIHGGDPISDSIRLNIERCNEFVVLLSKYSTDRQWVLVEVGAAWALRKHVVAITDKITPEEMPDITRSHKAIDLNEFATYLKEMIDRAKKVQ